MVQSCQYEVDLSLTYDILSLNSRYSVQPLSIYMTCCVYIFVDDSVLNRLSIISDFVSLKMIMEMPTEYRSAVLITIELVIELGFKIPLFLSLITL